MSALTAVEQNVYPVRVQVSATGLINGDNVTIFRVQGSIRTPVRGANVALVVAGTTLVVVDAELPFGVPVHYELEEITGVVSASTANATHTLVGGKVVVSDATQASAAETVITSWPERDRTASAAVYNVAGRNLVVYGSLGQSAGVVEFFCEMTSAVDQLLSVLETATAGVVQLRQPGGYDGVDCYAAVLGVTVKRFSQDGSDQRRLIAVGIAETSPWADSLEARGFTYADMMAVYTGLTYVDLGANYATYLALQQGDFS